MDLVAFTEYIFNGNRHFLCNQKTLGQILKTCKIRPSKVSQLANSAPNFKNYDSKLPIS